MARKPKVTYWTSRAAYGCWIRGTQHILAKGPKDDPDGPTYLDALDRFRQLLSLENVDTAADDNTVRVVCEMYLQHAKTTRRATTVRLRQRALAGFIKARGELPVKQLKKIHVLDYIRERRERKYHEKACKECGWSDGSVRLFIDSLSVAMNWAADTGLITKNPVSGLERPSAKRRAPDAVLTDEQKQRIFAASKPGGRDFITVLDATGARPGELIHATTADYDRKLGAIVYKADDRRREDEFAHKTAYTGQDRVIYLTGDARAVVERLALQRPAGPLFRTSYSAVQNRFRRLRIRLGIPGLTAYSYRHTLATRWLMRGEPIEVLARLLGNSPATILKHYSHLHAQHATLRGHLERFMSADKTQTSGPVASPSGGPVQAGAAG
jgi:integrase